MRGATGFIAVFHSSGPENTFKLLHRASAVALNYSEYLTVVGHNSDP